MRPRSARVFAGSFAFGLAAACHVGCSGTGSVVFGATTEINPQLIDSLAVTVTVDGEPHTSTSIPRSELGFPYELRLAELSEGSRVDAEFALSSQGTVVLIRRASTEVVADRELLFPFRFEAACAGAQAPTCPAEQTCSAGQCVSAFRAPEELGDYYPGWAGTSGDRCEPGGPPELTVGQGQAAYLPVGPSEVLQVEAGPQGGYHVWVAARVKNVKQSGTVTEVSGRIDAANYDVPPFSVVFTLEGDEGGYCRIFGLRYRLDDAAHPIESLLGLDLDLTVRMTDADGDVATGSQRVRLSDTIL